jgi:nitrite reductase/ring-hydroxylating ferredoxin subunit/uncharacterized membrane protein
MIDKSLIDRAIESQTWIEPTSETLQNAVGGFLRSSPPLLQLKNFLHGVWFGHPLHPAVVDIPVGMWTAAMVLDLAGEATGSEGLQKAADTSIAVGIAGAVGAAATGLADWSDTFGRPRSLGLVHATLNTAALTLYGASLAARLFGARRAGVGLAVSGYAVATAASYIGGEMVFQTGQGVNRDAWLEGADTFTDTVALEDLEEEKPRKVEVDGQPVCLLRRGTRLYAIGNTCSHMGGPLDEGELDGEVIQCPWHGSRFDMVDGRVVGGPATFAQPRYETRVREGKVQVRRLPGDAAMGG